MANNQNSSNLLLENIDNEIPIEFELITENVDTLDNSGRSTKLLENNIAFLKELILKLSILS